MAGSADNSTPKQKKIKIWRVLNKCYAKGDLYLEGDKVEGGDFADNPNFKEMGSKTVEVDAKGNIVDIPHTEV